MAHQPAHWPPDEDDPPSGGIYGTPGGSAMAHYQQVRAREWATFARTLPWRLAAVIAAGALAGTLTHAAGPRLAGLAAALAAAAVGWHLRFRVSAETAAWCRGARGERRTARHLRKLVRSGWTVLHDLAIPHSRANGDHLLIGPPGVFLVDSKAWRHHHPRGRRVGLAQRPPPRPDPGHGPLGSPAARQHDRRAGTAAAMRPRHQDPLGRDLRRQRPDPHPDRAARSAAVPACPHGPHRRDAAGRACPPPTAPRNLNRASFPGQYPGATRRLETSWQSSAAVAVCP
jgi:hypothetical protein